VIYLLAGPPCSGKSTLARKLATPEDRILDFDDICAELDGRPGWTHTKQVRERAAEILEQRTGRLPQTSGDTYLIRCAPHPNERASLARTLPATVWLLNPGHRECMRRAVLTRRPPRTIAAIRDWYTTYRPASVDQRPPRV
jgi:predicted kinase